MANRPRTPAAKKQAAAPEPDQDSGLASLLAPKDGTMLAVEKALLRGEGAHASPSIAEQIAARLAGLIALDLLAPGQRLYETAISDTLRVSRAPVREALRILERDHLVQVSARRGATVTAPDADELVDIFEVRVALFSILLEQVMRDRPADLEALFDRLLPRLEEAARESPQAYAVQSFLCNLDIADLCSNRLVVDQLKAISLRTLRYVRLGISTPEAAARSMRSWRAFRSAVAKRDIPQVIETATKRITNVRDLSTTALRKAAPVANA
jgi:DNA-binding GntR family transcriptional regulator